MEEKGCGIWWSLYDNIRYDELATDVCVKPERESDKSSRKGTISSAHITSNFHGSLRGAPQYPRCGAVSRRVDCWLFSLVPDA